MSSLVVTCEFTGSLVRAGTQLRLLLSDCHVSVQCVCVFADAAQTYLVSALSSVVLDKCRAPPWMLSAFDKVKVKWNFEYWYIRTIQKQNFVKWVVTNIIMESVVKFWIFHNSSVRVNVPVLAQSMRYLGWSWMTSSSYEIKLVIWIKFGSRVATKIFEDFGGALWKRLL